MLKTHLKKIAATAAMSSALGLAALGVGAGAAGADNDDQGATGGSSGVADWPSFVEGHIGDIFQGIGSWQNFVQQNGGPQNFLQGSGMWPNFFSGNPLVPSP